MIIFLVPHRVNNLNFSGKRLHVHLQFSFESHIDLGRGQCTGGRSEGKDPAATEWRGRRGTDPYLAPLHSLDCLVCSDLTLSELSLGDACTEYINLPNPPTVFAIGVPEPQDKCFDMAGEWTTQFSFIFLILIKREKRGEIQRISLDLI